MFLLEHHGKGAVSINMEDRNASHDMDRPWFHWIEKACADKAFA
jgi:hypothetical protein